MNFIHKKKWGQHFLHDPNIARKIVAQAEPCAGEAVWEVGPGHGILTRALLDTGANVLCFEIDNALLPYLRSTFTAELDTGRLTIVGSDVLRADWQAELEEMRARAW